MAVLVVVAALCSQRALEFWRLLGGTPGVVEFLYLNSSTFFELAAIIQEAEVVVLQVNSSDVFFDPIPKRLCKMPHIDLKVCSTAASVLPASFKSFSIRSSVLCFNMYSALRVSLVPPLMTSLSTVFILVALDISLLLIFAHALTPTLATFVGPASSRQLFT